MSQISTHILDTALGSPAAGVTITLYQRDGAGWAKIGSGLTNDDGRIPDLCPAGEVLPAGTYRMHFATGAYFDAINAPVFYPWVEVVFHVDGGGQHYHIPLLLSPFGHSTYRGS